MIITGSTKIFDVINERNCSDLADFNLRFFGRGVGARLPGTPVLCGSVIAKGDTNSFTCYTIQHHFGGWQEFVRMEGTRDNAAGIVYKNKFHVFGGLDNSRDTLRTSVIISRNGEVIDGPYLPIGIHGHAITTVNSSVSIISGGLKTLWFDITNQTWYYNHETKNFTSGPPLHRARTYHGSATIIDRMTKVKIPVVTGGYRDKKGSTELLIKGQWQTGII